MAKNTGGGLESLRFDVVLDYQKFNEGIDYLNKRADELQKRLTAVVDLSKSVSTKQIISAKSVENAKAMSQHLDNIAKKIESMPKGSYLVGDADKLNTTLGEIQKRLDSIIEKKQKSADKTKEESNNTNALNSKLVTTSSLLRTISSLTGVTFGAIGIRRFLSSLIDITGQFEVQRMALRNMLQDIDAADKIYQDLYRFSSESTYRFSELAKYAKQLAAFNIPKEDLLETTKMLGDVASGVGVSMDRIILAYGHVKSSGFLRGIQLRSFSQNGVPVLEELSKILTEVEGKTVSLGDVFDKMMRRQIPFEMVEQAFKNMTSEGGKFYKMQEVLAKTLAGQINILKGRWENMLAALGEANSGILKDTVSSVSNLISSLDNVGRLAKSMVVAFGAYAAGVAIAHVAINGFGASLLNVGVALEKFYLRLMSNPYAVIGVALAAVTTAMYKYATSLSDAEKITKAADDGIGKFKSSLAAESTELDRLYAKLRLAAEGTEEYDRVKREIQNRFGPYIDEINQEAGSVKNLADMYDDLSKKIKESLQARFLESESAAVRKSYEDATGGIYESFKKTAKFNNWSIADQEDIWRYIVTGELKNQSIRRKLYESGGGTIGLPGTALFKDFGRSAESLRTSMVEATQAYDASMASLEDLLKTEGNGVKKAHAALTGWRRTVQETLYTLDQKYEKTFMPKEDEDYFEYLERVGKHYKEVNEYKDKALEKDKQIYENELDAIRKIDQALEGNILKDARYTKTPWNGSDGSGGKSQAQLTIENEIRLLEKFKSAYEKLVPFVGEENIGKVLKSLFDPTGENGYTFENIDERIITLADSLAQFGEKAKLAGEQIKASLGLDNASLMEKTLKKEKKAAEDAQKAIDKYIDALEKWTNKEKPMEGEGVAYKIGKAIADYRTAIAEAEKKYKDVTTMPGANSVGNMQAMLNMGRDQNAARAQLRTTVLGNIRPFIKEMLEQEGYDLTNWNDKTLWQINEIREALSKIELPEWIKKLLESSNLTDILNEAEEKLEEEGDNIDNKTLSPEALKKIGKVSKYAAKEVAGLASSFRELGEATGNDMLSGLADGIDSLSGALSSIASGASQGGAIGAFVGLLTFMASHFFKLWADEERKAAEATEKYTMALLEADVAYKKVMADAATSANTAFGSDALGSIRKQMEYAEQYREYLMYFIDNWKSMPDLYSRYEGEGGNVDWQRLLADINAGVILKDTPALEEFKRNIEGIISAEEALKSTTEDLFGDLASSLADQFIANFKSMGNAVDDFGDTFENLGETILNSLLQSYIIENILKKYEAEANSSLAKYANGQMTPDEYAAWLDGFADNVRMESEALAPAINGLIGAFADRGLLGMDSETTNSLGSGIKSITEETASLLASYINAIRADVSYMRGLQERGFGAVELIGQAIPTLNDYLAQIAATNFDIAQSNQSILTELQSVIGAEGSSGSIVRVQLA